MNLNKKIHKSDQTIYYQRKYFTPPQKKKNLNCWSLKKIIKASEISPKTSKIT